MLLESAARAARAGAWLCDGRRLSAPVWPVPLPPTPPPTPEDEQTLKQLSASVPAMTQAQAAARPQPTAPDSGSVDGADGGGCPPAPAASPAAVAAAAAAATAAAAAAASAAAGGPGGSPSSSAAGPGSSKSRQKKFHRHFKTVAPEEHVLNYYSCALVGDILLQGHLYITKNYFAFYSNVFGYVTKLLIPTVSVLKVSKEKTARIIPNAIGVATGLEKHVFGSLLSRDSTYKLMVQVWKEAIAQGHKPGPVQVIKSEDDTISTDIILHEDEESSSGSERSCPPTPDCPTDISHYSEGVGEVEPGLVPVVPVKLPNGSLVAGTGTRVQLLRPPLPSVVKPAASFLPRPTLILLVCTALLAVLFLSAAFLLYRIGRIHDQFSEGPLLVDSDEVYQEILKWQTQLHSRSANEVQEFLNTNLNQLAKVRQSLEALSLLIVSEEQHLQRQQRRSGAEEAPASASPQHLPPPSQQRQQQQQQDPQHSLPHDRPS